MPLKKYGFKDTNIINLLIMVKNYNLKILNNSNRLDVPI